MELAEYISQDGLTTLWNIGGVGLVMITTAIFLWSYFIGNIRKKLLLFLGGLFAFYAVVTFSASYVGQTFPEWFGLILFIRAVGNAAMPNVVGMTMLAMCVSAFMLTPAEKEVVIDGVELLAYRRERKEAMETVNQIRNAVHISK